MRKITNYEIQAVLHLHVAQPQKKVYIAVNTKRFSGMFSLEHQLCPSDCGYEHPVVDASNCTVLCLVS
jgi:hypothetical protein